jgi:hypothetical protein
MQDIETVTNTIAASSLIRSTISMLASVSKSTDSAEAQVRITQMKLQLERLLPGLNTILNLVSGSGVIARDFEKQELKLAFDEDEVNQLIDHLENYMHFDYEMTADELDMSTPQY